MEEVVPKMASRKGQMRDNPGGGELQSAFDDRKGAVRILLPFYPV